MEYNIGKPGSLDGPPQEPPTWVKFIGLFIFGSIVGAVGVLILLALLWSIVWLGTNWPA